MLRAAPSELIKLLAVLCFPCPARDDLADNGQPNGRRLNRYRNRLAYRARKKPSVDPSNDAGMAPGTRPASELKTHMGGLFLMQLSQASAISREPDDVAATYPGETPVELPKKACADSKGCRDFTWSGIRAKIRCSARLQPADSRADVRRSPSFEALLGGNPGIAAHQDQLSSGGGLREMGFQCCAIVLGQAAKDFGDAATQARSR